MKDHLAGEAPTHPLAKYIDNFENARHPDVKVDGSSDNANDLLDQIQTLLTNDCGPGNLSCLKFRDFNPTNLLAPFTRAEAAATGVVNDAARAVELQESLIANQVAEVEKAAKIVSNLEKTVSDFSAQQALLLGQINAAQIKLSQIPTPGGHFVVPTKRVCVFHKCADVPLGLPPVWVPDALDPLVNQLNNTIANLQAQVNNITNKLNDLNNQLQAARRDLTYKRSIEALQSVLRQLQEKERQARGALETVLGIGRMAQAIVDNLVPCTGRLSGR
jgi:FtsZ-binding cell division protein ZapB